MRSFETWNYEQAAQAKNDDDFPIYGCYVSGRNRSGGPLVHGLARKRQILCQRCLRSYFRGYLQDFCHYEKM